jgi:hypothetical protein
MNLFELVDAFCLRTGIPSPALLDGSRDAQARQIVALLNEVLEELTDRWSWTNLQREAVFTVVAGESQGLLTTLAPFGFKFIINNTIFNRTTRLPLFGPLDAAGWQTQKTLNLSGPLNNYRIVRGELFFLPISTPGHICAFEYASNFSVTDSSGANPSPIFLRQTDVSSFPDQLLLAGLRWKWKSEKGLDYSEDFRRYEEIVNNSIARDGSRPILNMGASRVDAAPAIIVSPGNWPL